MIAIRLWQPVDQFITIPLRHVIAITPNSRVFSNFETIVYKVRRCQLSVKGLSESRTARKREATKQKSSGHNGWQIEVSIRCIHCTALPDYYDATCIEKKEGRRIVSGIFGIISTRTGKSADLDQMSHALTHRGPDDEHRYVNAGVAIGCRRLSIQDIRHGR